MWLNIMGAISSPLWLAGLTRAALLLDGTRAVLPVAENDPSPISDINTYYPDVHDCPLPCVDYANIHSWIPYFSIQRLGRCQSPLLLQLSVTQPLDDPKSVVLLRACSLESGATHTTTPRLPVANPKKDNSTFEPSLDNAPACLAPGIETEKNMNWAVSHGRRGDENGQDVARLLLGMRDFFDARDNCDEKFIFAYHNNTVASAYIGENLGKRSVSVALKALADRLQGYGPMPSRAIAQLCQGEQGPESMVGISVDTTGDLAAVQRTAYEWSMGKCAPKDDFLPLGSLPGFKAWEINTANTTLGYNQTSLLFDFNNLHKRSNLLRKRKTCRYVTVVPGDSCGSLVSRCATPIDKLLKFNSKPNLCATLMPGENICCSAGDAFKPEPPKPSSDGMCAVHVIQNGDTCFSLTQKHGITVEDIEKWNKGNAWAWDGCSGMLVGYNMCISSGQAPLPPPQEGTECGPMVPGTEKELSWHMKRQKSGAFSMAELNPCPLKSCCSIWGYCGIFPAHCDVNAPPGGGPGSKKKGYQNTCISNCGMDIKQNSGPPKSFQRIGYYESYNLQRDCLWLKAKDANTDGTYTHIHWAFLEIDPLTWKPVVNDPDGQWSDFKALTNLKRIVSFGGWSYSTEPATYKILRDAILINRETFAANLAQFAQDEGIDGIDIDWEYPGVQDITVNGQAIGNKNDGLGYLKFLTVLREKLSAEKSVSIAAPASFWYLKPFPIDRIAAVIDYIVYMTYDLHGQWDYGKPNSFDSCDLGKCIRSHVNITETKNALAIITKAGVPNNKIFVGESSYGRSFRMASENCWRPHCQFTGSFTQSDANPGRCTKTPGYISNAEISEIIKRGDGVQSFHDHKSDTDVMLYRGDYVGYMTPQTKEARRAEWKNLNFAGSIDWALDLQDFTSTDYEALPTRPKSGKGCIEGEELTDTSGDLCKFACGYGFCPEALCRCLDTGTLKALPDEKPDVKVNAVLDSFDVELQQLCKFACKYGHCPEEICSEAEDDSDGSSDDSDESSDKDDPMSSSLADMKKNIAEKEAARRANANQCYVFKDTKHREMGLAPCRIYCQNVLTEAAEQDRTSNYGCAGYFPLGQEIPWTPYLGSGPLVSPGRCICDHWLVNEIADTVLEAMPIIAQIGCYILMSSFKLVLDLGSSYFGRAGKIVDTGVDMLTTGAQMASYIYPEDQKPQDAFSWWLTPCGGTDLVPEDIKTVFDVLNQVSPDRSSFRRPKKLRKGSGKKGDDGNPTTRAPVRPQPAGGNNNRPGSKKKKCSVPPHKSTFRTGHASNTIRMLSCNRQSSTRTTEMVITSLVYAAQAQPTVVYKTCSKHWSQACFHYSSVNRENPQWSTLKCPVEAATLNHRLHAAGTATWLAEHTGAGWRDKAHRVHKECHMDEWPPAYLMGTKDPARVQAGKTKQGQRVRYLPDKENTGAASLWRSLCVGPALHGLTDADFKRLVERDRLAFKSTKRNGDVLIQATATVNTRPEFAFGAWGHSANPPRDDGLWDNPCWPKAVAANDPGFALLSLDDWYDKNPRAPGRRTQWDYRKPYQQGTNGD